MAYPGRLHRCVQYPFVTRTDERVHVGSLDFRRTRECVEEPGDAPTRLGVFDTSAATPQLSHPRHPAPRPGWGTRTSSTPNAISSWRRIGSTTVSYWTTTLGYSQDELAAAMARVVIRLMPYGVSLRERGDTDIPTRRHSTSLSLGWRGAAGAQD